jgi:hypothetical protein
MNPVKKSGMLLSLFLFLSSAMCAADHPFGQKTKDSYLF